MGRTRIAASLLSMIVAGAGAFAQTQEPAQPSGSDAPAQSQAHCRHGNGAGGCGHCKTAAGESTGTKGAMHRHGATGESADAPRGMHGKGRGQGRGMQSEKAGDHRAAIHALVVEHASITRKVVEVENGVKTETTSSDAEVVANLRRHALEMKERVESGEPIRMFDPLFQEIFANHEKIVMKVEEIPGGVRVVETSADPKVVELIRAHAKAVSEFTAKGMERVHEPTPLPEGYTKK